MIARLSPFAALLLGACAVLEPAYERPAAPVPAAWPPTAAATSDDAPLPAWKTVYADPKIAALIGQALAQNRDLRIAALTIERARAQYRVQRAQSVPAIDATASGAIQGFETAAGETVTRDYSVGVGVTSFEVDLFGRVRSLNRAALQRYLATADARESVQISLVAEVAAAYLTFAGDLDLLRLAQETLASQQRSLELTQRRVAAGASSQLDLERARTTVETARADVARYTAFVAQDENLLALLIGGPVPQDWRPTRLADVAFGVDELPAALPSNVLLTRPDIREAERTLRAANADIGAARAAFFPNVTISAFGGQSDARFENLFSGAGGAWSFTPQVSLPLFDGGARRAGLGVARADRDIAIASYERSIQVAFREVADALAARGTIEEELAARQALTAAAQESYRLSEARYNEGIDSYLSLLDAQRELYAAQQALVSTQVSRATNFVTLYKVLGGGV
ncbi:MAG: efflux transporter outer membrane subunit [Hyphomonadaceae bacterium]|nr:efflux transporter outer membrane subunit [Hyphomonadaceae bacterium]